MRPVAIGTPPFSREELIASLAEFSELYEDRPVKDNQGGMCASLLFGAWFMAKKLEPQTIIESGVWKGLGTWFFEKACPSAELICIDPVPQNMQYKSPTAKYFTQDFSMFDWKETVDCEKTLCFFDDHQNAISRLEVGGPQGFKHFMFEDNYPRRRGDCVSLKTALEEGTRDGAQARMYLNNYSEIPPVVKNETTRWGDPWTDVWYPTHPPLLEKYDEKYDCYFTDSDNYTWLCYVKARIGGLGDVWS